MTTPTTPPTDAVVVTREHRISVLGALYPEGLAMSAGHLAFLNGVEGSTQSERELWQLARLVATTEHRARLACAGEVAVLRDELAELKTSTLTLDESMRLQADRAHLLEGARLLRCGEHGFADQYDAARYIRDEKAWLEAERARLEAGTRE